MATETLTPAIGMPATIFYGSDSYAAEVIAVTKSGKTITLRQGGTTMKARLTKRGWRAEGLLSVALGYARDYRDPHV